MLPAIAISDTLHSINTEQHLYVLPCGKGFSTWGFKNIIKRVEDLTWWLEMETEKDKYDTESEYDYRLRVWNRYETLMRVAKLKYEGDKVRCPIDLSPQLIGREGKRVEVVDQDGTIRRFWVEKSMGWMPCHLEVHNSRSTGGPPASKEYAKVRTIA